MANKTLFAGTRGAQVPKADTVNLAGGKAYSLPAKQALAQYVSTGCFNSTFYADGGEQLERILELASQVEPEFVAKAAIYSRQSAFMKDSPALLCAILAAKDVKLLERIFPRVIDNGKMLRNFVQILRSGVTGRKSFGTAVRRLIRNWFDARSEHQVFRASVGNDPSMADVIKMVHPKAQSQTRNTLYRYILGKQIDGEQAAYLPPLVQEFERFKAGNRESVPEVPHEMLTALPLDKAAWTAIARNMGWQATRMNLNTMLRHGVFEDKETVALIAARLRDKEAIQKAKAFPYQLLAAFINAKDEIPFVVREALQDAMEIATENIPAIDGKVWIFPDVSGSMSDPITGHRYGSTSKIRCVDVAGLVAASILRKNPSARVIPFEGDVVNLRLNPRDSIMTNAKILAGVGGGGTSCSAPMRLLNHEKETGDLIIYVSDNESWADRHYYGSYGTPLAVEWAAFKVRNPKARMACIDLTPNETTQASDRQDTINIGGFSDAVFRLLALFAEGGMSADHWTGVIEAEEI